jgi:hypothetical protein
MTKPITLKMLKKAGACQDQVDLFEKLFGKSVIPTRELALEHASDFDFQWAAENLLTSQSLKAYEKTEALAWKAYKKATALALKACEEARALAFLKQWERRS